MTGVLALAWSIARSGWRANYNRSFRFSKLKAGAIALGIQILFFYFIARRAPVMVVQQANDGLWGVVVLIMIQMGWFGVMTGFSRGMFQLYQGILVPLFQIVPARPLGFLLGRMIEAVPTRAFSTLLWAWVYSGLLPGDDRLGYAVLLAAVGITIGMLAYLSGLLILAFWSRYSARSLRNGLLFFGATTLALATWAVIFLAQGGTVTDLALTMRSYRIPVIGTMAVLAGFPGLVLLSTLLLKPTYVEDLYRRGVYNVIELGETDITRPARSVWLPIREGVLRAVLSREWLQLSRAKVTRIQLMIWAAGMVGVFVAGRNLVGAPTGTLVQYIGALNLLTWFVAFGHWVIRTFETERVTVTLYRLAAIPTWKLLLAKFISLFVPSTILVSLGTLIGCVSASCSGPAFGSVLGWSIASLIGGSLGGFGMAAATAGEEPDDPETAATPRREMGSSPAAGSSAWWSVARTVALIATTALPLWAGAGQPGLTAFKLPEVPLLATSALLPSLLVIVGSWLMIKTWEAHG